MPPRLTALCSYPLKSAPGLDWAHQAVTAEGVAFDRRLAVIGDDGEVVTAREHPELLALSLRLDGAQLDIERPGAHPLRLAIEAPDDAGTTTLTVHGAPTHGRLAGEAADAWFSDLLGGSCRVVHLDPARPREVLVDHGGRPGDRVGFADECPILLANEGSLADLNARLAAPVSMRQFRPNLVVAGADAFAEDGWRRVVIGAVEFEVAQPCKRCVFATIDPVTRERHPEQEPLRTLAGYHPASGGGAAFGMHLVPRNVGEIAVGDEVVVDA